VPLVIAVGSPHDLVRMSSEAGTPL
jgi:hypothetical protein